MSELLSCSDELLIMIAKQLRFSHGNDPLQAQGDTVNLAQTCRRLKGAVDEVLYHTAIISKRKQSDKVFGGSFLIRTLVRQPKLAQKMSGLKVSITGISNRVGHTESCPLTSNGWLEECLCDWLPTAGRLDELIRGKDYLAGLDTLKQKWLRGIRVGEEPAILGALLACLPNLRSLTIRKRGVSKKNGWGEIIIIEHGQIDPWEMFGLIARDHQDIISRISGFSKLEHLSANCLPAPCMFNLPAMKTLELHAFACDNISAWNSFVLDNFSLTKAATYFNTDIRKLTFATDNEMLTKDSNVHSGQYNISTMILRHAHQLVELIVKVIPNGDMDDLYSFGRYQSLIDRLRCVQIETLVIDSSAVSRKDMGLDLIVSETNKCSRTIAPCQNLSSLRKLRKLIVNQEVLFNACSSFDPCELPTAIEEISVVGTTLAIHRWVRYIFDNTMKYTQLKTIKLWVGDESKLHFGADSRLGHPDFDSDEEDYDEEDYEEYYDIDEQEDPAKQKSGELGDVEKGSSNVEKEKEGSGEKGDNNEKKPDTGKEKKSMSHFSRESKA